MAQARQRRTQLERRTETRTKLTDATLDVIHDSGYRRTTTAAIAVRAGVSRGALMHHFATKSDVVTAAMESLLEDTTERIRATASRVRAGDVSLEEFVEFVWALFSGRFFYLSLEFINAARTDARLRAKMMPVVKRFHGALDDIWVAYYRDANLSQAQAQTALNMTLCLVRGMGAQTVLKDDPQYYREMLDLWKAWLPNIMEPSRRGPAIVT